MINTEKDYSFIRQTLLSKPIIPEYQIASRIAQSIQFERDEIVEDSLVRSRLDKPFKFDKNLIIHYTYEKRFQCNQRYFHQLWNQTFQQTAVMERRLLIGNRNSPNMTRESVYRRPNYKQYQLTTKLQP